MIELIFAEEGTFAMTAPDQNDYAVMRFATCPIYAIITYCDIEGCQVHGLYNTYKAACDSIMMYCRDNIFMPSDNVTAALIDAEYNFPDGIRDMSEYIETVWRYGG